MHAIYPLISGIQGAAAGTARIFARGTTVRAPYWLDFEATQQVANTADIKLDSNGGAEVYVGQLVDVTVFDASGNEVRQFVAGSEAPNVEVRSQSFTGTDYVTAASAAGNPTTLQAVLDRALTSFGAVDWKVLIGSTPTLLATALASVSGVVFNVKSPTYGAVGNGTTDDTAAIQAAVTAASVSGGIVLFPQGVYRITAALTLNTKVSLLGIGASASVIKLDHATNHAVTWTSASSGEKSIIARLGFSRAQTGSGVFVLKDALDLCQVLLVDCYFNGATVVSTSRLVGGQSGGYSGTSLEAYRCTFRIGTGDGIAAGSGPLTLVGCVFTATSAYSGIMVQQIATDGLCMAFNRLDASGVSSGTFNYLQAFEISGNGQLSAVVGNAFVSPAGGTGTVALGDAMEWGNSAGSAVLFTSGVTSSTSYTDFVMAGRERAYRRISNAFAAYTMPNGDGTSVITQNFAGNMLVTVPSFSPGRRGRLYVHNADGTNRGLTFLTVGAAGVDAVSGASITLNTATYTQIDWEFIYINSKATFCYRVTDANRAVP